MNTIPDPIDLLERLRSAEKDFRTLSMITDLGLLESIPAVEIKRMLIESSWYLENKDGFQDYYTYLGYKLDD